MLNAMFYLKQPRAVQIVCGRTLRFFLRDPLTFCPIDGMIDPIDGMSDPIDGMSNR